jgi:transcription elongation factor GreA
MADQQIISQEGYDKLQEELNFLSTTKRREIAERIEKAKDLGDLSENAEYSEAKDAQALNDGRIAEITAVLKNVVVVAAAHSSKEVTMGSHITVEGRGKVCDYVIVSFNEASPLDGKISNESPLGVAFLGKKKGDEVTVETPKGEVEYKIIDIK